MSVEIALPELVRLQKESGMTVEDFYTALVAIARQPAILRATQFKGDWTSERPNPAAATPAITL